MVLLTGVVGLAIDEPVETPATETHDKNIQYQVEEQQRSCYVSSHCSHFLFSIGQSLEQRNETKRNETVSVSKEFEKNRA